jgi:SAM-dependent methyltransferase
VGVDIAQPALDVAKQAMLEAGVAVLPALVLADAKKLPFADASFDRIFFLGVLDHMHDWELEAAFSEFKRVLKPGGFVLANTCTNTQYYKSLSYGWRKKAAQALGLRPPTRMRSEHDEEVHVNEHSQKDLERFFSKIGWRGDIEARPNDKLCIRELYGEDLPEGFPIRPASSWKRFGMALAFRGPWKRVLAREFFCTISPAGVEMR